MNAPASLGRLRDRIETSFHPPPRLPRPLVTAGRCAPVWSLRAALAAVALGCAALVVTNGTQWQVAAVVIGVMTMRPHGFAPGVFAAGAGALLLASDRGAGDVRVFLLVGGVHLTSQLAAIVGDMPAGGVVEIRVLRDAGRRFLAVQAFAQSAAGFGAWIASQGTATVWIPLAGALAVAAVAWWLLVRIRSYP